MFRALKGGAAHYKLVHRRSSPLSSIRLVVEYEIYSLCSYSRSKTNLVSYSKSSRILYESIMKGQGGPDVTAWSFWNGE